MIDIEDLVEKVWDIALLIIGVFLIMAFSGIILWGVYSLITYLL